MYRAESNPPSKQQQECLFEELVISSFVRSGSERLPKDPLLAAISLSKRIRVQVVPLNIKGNYFSEFKAVNEKVFTMKSTTSEEAYLLDTMKSGFDPITMSFRNVVEYLVAKECNYAVALCQVDPTHLSLSVHDLISKTSKLLIVKAPKYSLRLLVALIDRYYYLNNSVVFSQSYDDNVASKIFELVQPPASHCEMRTTLTAFKGQAGNEFIFTSHMYESQSMIKVRRVCSKTSRVTAEFILNLKIALMGETNFIPLAEDLLIPIVEYGRVRYFLTRFTDSAVTDSVYDDRPPGKLKNVKKMAVLSIQNTPAVLSDIDISCRATLLFVIQHKLHPVEVAFPLELTYLNMVDIVVLPKGKNKRLQRLVVKCSLPTPAQQTQNWSPWIYQCWTLRY